MRRNEYISSAGLRKDGRRPNEIRRIQYKFGAVEHADGSVYYQQGLTRVLAIVYGPQEIGRRTDVDAATVSCEFHQTPFCMSERKKGRRGVGSSTDRKSIDLAKTVKQSVESVIISKLFPRSLIKIVLYGIQSDGSLLCACINAATLALVDAGIPMTDFVVACSAGYFHKTYVTDLNYLESSSDHPNMPVAIVPRTNKIVMLKLKSKIETDNFEGMLTQARKGCEDIHSILRDAVKDRACARLSGQDTLQKKASSSTTRLPA